MPNIRLSRSASMTQTGEGVILRSDLGTFQITGPDMVAFLELMIPLLDGSRDREALFHALSGYSRPSVGAFLDLLQNHGLIEAVNDAATFPGRLRGQQEFLGKWSVTPKRTLERLAAARVLVIGLEPWGASAAAELSAAGIAGLHLVDDGELGPRDLTALRGRGEAVLGATRREVMAALLRERAPWCRIEDSSLAALEATPAAGTPGSWDLIIVAIRPDDLVRMERVARFAHRSGTPSLWSHLDGETAILGPLVAPGKTACPLCALTEVLQPPRTPVPGPSSPVCADAAAQLLGHLVAIEAVKAITEYTLPRIGGRMLVQQLATLEASIHTLVRLPWCRVCGERP
ncbi:TOMM precursor leader peptide-binding protein [Nannocystis bainbridge]|uniref:TOMM leader peptide-binding protein n=1 Tax=Nannocystis bainbridge TaxID=2995303 RepID=A0ABT5DVB2_9BACT|nr:TOMM precursor leader peptide-binding protein [Nannocystis bainbridge]MDC0717525.1 TOMM precursor leader peptide-binding protein [Nannocystis bainbridge]